MANRMIPADQVGAIFYKMLVDSVERTMEDKSREEKDLAVKSILEALSRSFFH